MRQGGYLSWLESLVYTQNAGGSSPSPPTIRARLFATDWTSLETKPGGLPSHDMAAIHRRTH